VSVLLDTHTFLWYSAADPQLSSTARDVLLDPAEAKLLSMASVWEMAVKTSIGKLPMAIPFPQMIAAGLTNAQCSLLFIELAHLAQVATLPLHHRDPFDRLLIAQAIVEGLPIVSRDSTFDAYGVKRLW
jgi:PIN domain nuclease of toxin-antitoxin system